MFDEKMFISSVAKKIYMCDSSSDVGNFTTGYKEDIPEHLEEYFNIKMNLLYGMIKSLGYKVDLGEKKPSEKSEEFVENKSISLTMNKKTTEQDFSANIYLNKIQDGKIVIKTKEGSKSMQQIFINESRNEPNYKNWDIKIVELDDRGLFILEATEEMIRYEAGNQSTTSGFESRVYFYNPESVDYITTEQQQRLINETLGISDIAKIIKDACIVHDYTSGYQEDHNKEDFSNVLNFYKEEKQNFVKTLETSEEKTR